MKILHKYDYWENHNQSEMQIVKKYKNNQFEKVLQS